VGLSLSFFFTGIIAATAVACAAPATTSDEEAVDAPSALGSDAYRAYADLATEGGGSPSHGTVTVLGLRGLSLDGTTHPTKYAHAFDDTLVVLRADGSVERFAGSTHPFERKGVPGVPDTNGDGVPDVGMIKPGVYDVTGRDRTIAGAASYAVTQRSSGKLPGWRDTDHDGILDDDERAVSDRRGDGLTDVLFHQGEGGAPAAVGCQVLPSSAIRAFTAAVGGARARFRYVLVDMTGRDTSSLPR
jgi:hypothetical protein